MTALASVPGWSPRLERRNDEECVWDQRPIPKLTGPRRAVRFVHIAHRILGLATIDVEIISIASKDDVVHTERIDRLRRAD